MRKYVEEYYFNMIKRCLGRREKTINEIIEELKLPRSTLQRWIDFFRIKGVLRERKENGKVYLRLEKRR
jgi:DNA-binding IclR family transcriptional regulator